MAGGVPDAGLRAVGRRSARGRRVGRPATGARVRRGAARRAPRVGGRQTCPLTRGGLRGDAPLLDAWLRFQEEAPTPFTIPGHKHRRDLVGDVVAGDVPLYAGLDTMKLSRGVLADAEARAARLWGADVCRFSVGGATHANQALALALAEGGDGGRVVVGRTLHRSMLLGLVLAGLTPVWVRPDVDPATGLPAGVPPAAVADALASAPDARAVLVADPSYVGTVGDVAGLAEVAHAHDVPLVVDAAWAAHFGFHPSLPRHALQLGADAMVVSAHKTLPGVEPGGAGPGPDRPHRRGPARRRGRGDADHQPGRRDPREHRRGASAAGTRRCVPARRRDRGRGHGARPARARSRGSSSSAGLGVDPLKLTLVLGGTGADGIAVEDDLLAAGLPVEAAERDTIVAQVSMADDADTLSRLTEALVRSLSRHRGRARPVVTGAAYVVEPVTVLSPRSAFFAPSETVPRRGRRSAGSPSSWSRPTRPASRSSRPARRSRRPRSTRCAGPGGRGADRVCDGPDAGDPPGRAVRMIDTSDTKCRWEMLVSGFHLGEIPGPQLTWHSRRPRRESPLPWRHRGPCKLVDSGCGWADNRIRIAWLSSCGCIRSRPWMVKSAAHAPHRHQDRPTPPTRPAYRHRRGMPQPQAERPQPIGGQPPIQMCHNAPRQYSATAPA